MTRNDIRSIRRTLTRAGYTKSQIKVGIAFACGGEGGVGAEGRDDGLELAVARILYYPGQLHRYPADPT